jgi:hypothetical protein
MTKTQLAQLAMASIGSGLLLWGCDRAPTTTTTTTTTTAAPAAASTAAPVAASPTVPKPVFSINELMVMVVDHPGELLWDVEKEGHAPKTAEDWYQLENHAVEVASAGTVIQLGGIGPHDAEWASQPLWSDSAQRLTTAALSARLAAHNHDLPELIKANGRIVDACEACHAKFKPDIPTGGLFIHKRVASAKP